jgi:hypothetical protein
MWSSKTRRNRIKIDTINTFIQDRSLFELDTGTSLKSGGVKLAIWSKQIQNCRHNIIVAIKKMNIVVVEILNLRYEKA